MTLAPQHSPQGTTETPGARAVNGLGLAIYRALDRSEPGQNLFVSPLSITAALTMLAEGAREETAAELAAALQLPANTPFAELHASMQALAARYRNGGGSADPALRQRITALREQLAAANLEAEKLSRGSDWEKARKAADRADDLARQINQLSPQLDRYELRVANALWVERTYPLVPAYVQALDRWYGTGGVNNLDIRGDCEAARSRINSWVEQNTERRIRDLIPAGGLGADTALVISNAVYFRGEWADPFEARDTRDENFLLADGGRTRVKLMRDTARASVPYAAFTGDGRAFATPLEVSTVPANEPPSYPGDDGFTMIELPYKGRELAMLVIAPRSPSGLPRVESLLNATSLASWTRQLDRRTVNTSMLRFEQRRTCELTPALQAAGVRRAFANPLQAGGAQLGGIAADARGLFVSGVHHQAWLQVDEKGTEAAAATAIACAPTCAMPSKVPFVPVFRADRPFLFLIRDVKSGAILFLGRVVDPRS